jgi:hypothetical protein
MANPTHLHYIYYNLANKGISLFIEKLKTKMEKLVALIENKSCWYVACNLRFHPCTCV